MRARILRLKNVECLCFCVAVSLSGEALAAEAPIRLRPALSPAKAPLTLVGTVQLTEKNFPQLIQQQAEVRAARKNVTLQKVKEYNPNGLMSYQDVVASHNRLTQTLFSSPSLPTTPGPGPETVTMHPKAFSAAGFIIDWAPLDFGLHKARIDFSKAEYRYSEANYGLTLLDATVEAATRFLDTLVMQEQVNVAIANVQRFSDFSTIVHAQVGAGLKAAADASLADSQLANARNDLIRARLNYDLARAALGYITGQGGDLLDIYPGGMIRLTEPENPIKAPPIFENHPKAISRRALVATRLASRKILDKQYYPTLRWLGGMSLRGTTFHTNRGDVEAPDVSGIFPVVPNWNVGLMIDFPFLDIIRINAEKKVVDERVMAARASYDLALQELKTEDVQACTRLQAATDLASNMPIQVQAAEAAARQAQARYQAGLATVAQVAEANQILADSRVKLAVANVGVWKALLSVSAIHGDIKPFLSAAQKATGGQQP